MFWLPQRLLDPSFVPPNVTWVDLQIFASFLLDKETLYPLVYVSLVGQRLRSCNALERYNLHSPALQTSTFEKIKMLTEECCIAKAMPPRVDRAVGLCERERKMTMFWTQAGLRPSSVESIMPYFAHEAPNLSGWIKIRVPAVKFCPSDTEIFYVYVPKDVWFPEIFPVSRLELQKLTARLGTTCYGPRRALALWLRLRAVELKIIKDNPSQKDKDRYDRFVQKVNAHLGWEQGSKMWTQEYTADVTDFVDFKFMIHPLLVQWFTE